MGGEGSMQSMATILRNNKRLLRKRNPFRRARGFERLRNEYRNYSSGTIKSKPLTKKELFEIRKKIKEQNRKENISSSILAVLALIVILTSTYLVFESIKANKKRQESHILKAKTEKYLFYIQDGDEWLHKGKFSNALFQYLLAKEVFPNEYDVNYRLVLVYGSRCKYEKSDCSNGKQFLEALITQFPEKKELEKLEQYFY